MEKYIKITSKSFSSYVINDKRVFSTSPGNWNKILTYIKYQFSNLYVACKMFAIYVLQSLMFHDHACF